MGSTLCVDSLEIQMTEVEKLFVQWVGEIININMLIFRIFKIKNLRTPLKFFNIVANRKIMACQPTLPQTHLYGVWVL